MFEVAPRLGAVVFSVGASKPCKVTCSAGGRFRLYSRIQLTSCRLAASSPKPWEKPSLIAVSRVPEPSRTKSFTVSAATRSVSSAIDRKPCSTSEANSSLRIRGKAGSWWVGSPSASSSPEPVQKCRMSWLMWLNRIVERTVETFIALNLGLCNKVSTG